MDSASALLVLITSLRCVCDGGGGPDTMDMLALKTVPRGYPLGMPAWGNDLRLGVGYGGPSEKDLDRKHLGQLLKRGASGRQV